jgi:hypothetical protein
MSDDIVARLRAVLHNDRSVELMNREAANEIERLRKELRLANIDAFNESAEADKLRAERDEARRSCCEFAAMVDSADTVVMYVDSNRFHEIAMKYMKSRGWDCFKENTND